MTLIDTYAHIHVIASNYKMRGRGVERTDRACRTANVTACAAVTSNHTQEAMECSSQSSRMAMSEVE